MIINFQVWKILHLRFTACQDLLCISDVKALQLDSANTIEEQVPITIDQPVETRISRLK